MTKVIKKNSLWKKVQALILLPTTSLFFYFLELKSQPIKILGIWDQTNVALAQNPSKISQQGSEIILNNRKYIIPWIQWQEGNQIRFGFADTAIAQLLGLELLTSKQPNQQIFSWFSSPKIRSIQVKTLFVNPYRYLDLTEFLKQNNTNFQIQGNSLNLISQPSQITNITVNRYGQSGRIVVDLDRPGFWQISQTPTEGVVMLEGNTPPNLLQKYPNQPPINNTINNLESDNPEIDQSKPVAPFLALENANSQTKLKIATPPGHGLQVWTMADPSRLVIDVRPDPFVEKEIQWHSGIIWRNSWVRLNNHTFPVVWLEVDLKSSPLTLKPIVSNQNTLIGISPLLTTARNLQPLAAINGGFFNRNNQLPLGAIRRDGKWLSSPILNRGAIAWNDQGQVKISRLRLEEFLTINNGQRLPILFLNSGYIQAGLARYTPDWGSTYTPLSDQETIIEVKNNQITNIFPSLKAGQNAIVIPPDGYLITIRSNPTLIQNFTIGTKVNLQTATIPQDFINYPHILGAGPVLLQNRQIVLNAASEQFSDAFNKQAASRSAIAVNNQGKLIIAAIHNRAGGKGPNLTELAQIMQRLGATDALNLDGGSSTSLYLGGQLIDRSPVTAARVHNGLGLFLK